MSDPYTTLGVPRSASEKEIKSAYRKLAMKYHPDKTGGCTDSEAKFKAVSEAYDCLKDPQRRAAYDRYGKAAFQNGGPGGGGFGGNASDFGDIGDIFESIFGSAFGGGRQQQRGAQRAGLQVVTEIEQGDADQTEGNPGPLQHTRTLPPEQAEQQGEQRHRGNRQRRHPGGNAQVFGHGHRAIADTQQQHAQHAAAQPLPAGRPGRTAPAQQRQQEQ